MSASRGEAFFSDLFIDILLVPRPWRCTSHNTLLNVNNLNNIIVWEIYNKSEFSPPLLGSCHFWVAVVCLMTFLNDFCKDYIFFFLCMATKVSALLNSDLTEISLNVQSQKEKSKGKGRERKEGKERKGKSILPSLKTGLYWGTFSPFIQAIYNSALAFTSC